MLQVLRRRRIARAAQIAEEIECARISVYPFMLDLEAMGVPIEAERGAGYRLTGYDILGWYTEDEVQALMLGMQVVRLWSDGELGDAAKVALAKIGAALPDKLKPALEKSRLKAKLSRDAPQPIVDLRVIRKAVNEKRKLKIDCKRTERVVNPMVPNSYPPWVLVAWCETRAAVPMFRVDRIRTAELIRESGSSEEG